MTITKGGMGNTEFAEGVNGEARALARLLIAAVTAEVAQLKDVLNTLPSGFESMPSGDATGLARDSGMRAD